MVASKVDRAQLHTNCMLWTLLDAVKNCLDRLRAGKTNVCVIFEVRKAMFFLFFVFILHLSKPEGLDSTTYVYFQSVSYHVFIKN